MTYLDHAATTPMPPEAVAAMSAALVRTGNASSLHPAGWAAHCWVEQSRASIAAGLGARPSDVVFTGGGTEGDNRRFLELTGLRDELVGRVLAVVPDAVLNGDRLLGCGVMAGLGALIDVFGRGGATKSSWYGHCLPSRDFPMLIDLHLQGRLPLEKVVTETIGRDDIEEAFHRMERGEVLRSVVVL